MRRALLSSRLGRVLLVVLAGIVLGTIAGLALLWPGKVDFELGAGLNAESERAEIVKVESFRCSGFQTDECRRAQVMLRSGSDAGERTTLELGADGPNPDLDVGDQVRVTKSPAAPPAEPGVAQPPASPSYTITDFERRAPMLWLAIAFAVCVVAFGRLRGALSLVGLAISLAVVLVFVVPAILDGKSPVWVAIVGSLAVMIVTISLAHGLGPKSVAAMLGTAASLLLTVGLALAFRDLTHLTGLSSEEATLLQINDAGVSLEGLLLAGIVIGALGVLDDVTISQSSTVMALRAANPALRFRELYSRALEVGRDHVSATVNTLVLAYVGASLPVLLIFSSGSLGVFDAVNVELIAKEVVAMLVGSIGLIAAVPITTALAALLSAQLDPTELEREGAAHAH